jgi:hypothetical protein
MAAASRSRDCSTTASARQPKTWLALAALPNRSVKYGRITSTTRGSVGVVAWWSR